MKSKNSRKIIVHILLLLGITITVFPFVWMILTSFKTVGEAMQIPPTIFPKKFLTDAYSSIVTALPFGRVYLNTIISTVVTTVVQVLFCSMAAYACQIRIPVKNAIFVLVLSVLMVPGQIFPGSRSTGSFRVLAFWTRYRHCSCRTYSVHLEHFF